MARRSFSLALAGVCLLAACGGKRTSVGGSAGRANTAATGGTTGGVTAGGAGGSGAEVGDAGQGAESAGGESSGTGGSNGGKGSASGGSDGATSGVGGSSAGNAGKGGATGGAGGSSASAGTGGSSGVSPCAEGTADCDDNTPVCETDLTSVATCGESCSDVTACDALSGATCVNGGCSNPWVAWPLPAEPTLAEVGDGTVKDEATRLVWQKASSPELRDHDDAIDYCTALTTGGHTDWRLPTLMELISIVDYGRHDPAIDTDRFSGTSDRYWTSTPRAGRLDMWIVYFLDGRPDYAPVEADMEVRCVR